MKDYIDGNAVADIYRLLPGRNCGLKGQKSPCTYEKCSDFATALLKGKCQVFDCPYLQDEKSQAIILKVEDYFQ